MPNWYKRPKEHQRGQTYPVKVLAWIFPLPAVFETYVRHWDLKHGFKHV